MFQTSLDLMIFSLFLCVNCKFIDLFGNDKKYITNIASTLKSTCNQIITDTHFSLTNCYIFVKKY
jgi:hypothetical protein